MKLSNQTISVLKNFASINQNLVIKEGNEITTMSAMKNIVAKAEVEENLLPDAELRVLVHALKVSPLSEVADPENVI